MVDALLTKAEESAAGRAAIGAALLAVGVLALALWVVAIWYVRTSDQVIARNMLTGVLIFTNFVGAFFYYWIVVHRRPERRLAFGERDQVSNVPRAV